MQISENITGKEKHIYVFLSPEANDSKTIQTQAQKIM